MVLSVVAGLALTPVLWMVGSIAGVAVATLVGEARIHYAVHRMTRV